MFEHTQKTEEISPKSYLEIKASYLYELISNNHLKEAQEICEQLYKQITFQIDREKTEELTNEHTN